jgi:hypothetical protein
VLSKGAAFKVWVAHNWQEAEPAAFHAQICNASKAGGLEIMCFGGMSNSTTGIELSGLEGQKSTDS